MLTVLLAVRLLASPVAPPPAAAAVEETRAVELARYAFVNGATEPFDAAYPRSVFVARVNREMAAERELASRYGVRIDRAALARELARIEENTKSREQWSAMKAALGDDRSRIEEAILRPTLVARLMAANGGVSSPEGRIPASKAVLSSDAWNPIAIPDTLRGVDLHSAVWTGTRMIVWGGRYFDGPQYTNAGAMYDPATDAWFPMSTVGAPLGRSGHTAVWTGSKMVVFGGFGIVVLGSGALDVDYENTGGRYDPVADTWESTTITGAPTPRYSHTAVWSGSRMVVWGGFSSATGAVATGGRYDPVNDSWTATSLSNGPSARSSHTAVWTGSTMIVWGGQTGTQPLDRTGGVYNAADDTWTASATSNAPPGRTGHTAVWTGSKMIIWGGVDPSIGLTSVGGGIYDPVGGSWISTSTAGAPSDRDFHTAVWTGTEMIIWGGLQLSVGGPPLNTGSRYDLAGDFWTPMMTPALTDPPSGRYLHTAIWTPTGMIVWGGRVSYQNPTLTNVGARWFYCATPPTPLASSNGPVCVGDDIRLTASSIPGATYAWTGPNGYTSALQNPTLANGQPADSGTYSVRATVGGCDSYAGSAAVVVQSCFGSANLIPDGRAVLALLPPGGTVHRVAVQAGRSYTADLEVPFDGAGTGPTPFLSITRGDGTTALTGASAATSACAPGAPARVSFVPDAADVASGAVLLNIVDSAASPYRYRVRVTETTQYCARWSVNGYSGIVNVQNTTDCPVTGQVDFLGSSGTLLSTQIFSLDAFGSVQIDAPDGISRFGTARLTHTGPPGGVTAGIYMVSGSGSAGANFRWPFLEVRAYGDSGGL